ncbi:MAG: hypothetical protein ACR2HJ_09325 [Fimbriimonadales bacterium]
MARRFLEAIEAPDARTAKLLSSKRRGSTSLYEITFVGDRTMLVNSRDGRVTDYWDETERAKKGWAFKSRGQAKSYIERVVSRLGLPKEAMQIDSHYEPPASGKRGYVGAEYEWRLSGKPVFCGGPSIALHLDPTTGKVSSYSARFDFIIEKSEWKVRAADAEAIVMRETARQYGSAPRSVGPPEFGYVLTNGNDLPYVVRLGWRVPIHGTSPYEAAVDAETGTVIGWLDIGHPFH